MDVRTRNASADMYLQVIVHRLCTPEYLRVELHGSQINCDNKQSDYEREYLLELRLRLSPEDERSRRDDLLA